MVLGDYLRRLFSKKDNNESINNEKNQFGITGLPRSIEEDLLEKHSNENLPMRNERSGNQYENEWQRAFPDFQVHIGPNYYEDENEESFQIEHDMMSQLEDMMNGFFRGFQMREFLPDFPQIEGPMVEGEKPESHDGNETLRDKMLKEPERPPFHDHHRFPIRPFQDHNHEEEEPQTMMDWFWTFPFSNSGHRSNLDELKDKDYDDDVRSGKSKLDDILEKKTEEKSDTFNDKSAQSKSFQKFSSITTRRRSDGVIESQKTIRDSQGNEEVTIIRKIGDQEHKTTTRKDSLGNEESKEDLVNMDAGELEKFEDAWARSKQNDGFPNFQKEWNSDLNANWNLSGSLHDIVKEFFFPWKKN